MHSQIHPIRQAARQLVRELNLLDGNFCIEGFSFSECHLLTELEAMATATASELGDRLVLEKSTMSRLINGLLTRGIIESRQDSTDRRKRLLNLTEKGRSAASQLNSLSDRQVLSALEFLSPADREIVIRGLRYYSGALSRSRLGEAFTLSPISRENNPTAARVIRAVMAEFGVSGEGFSSEDPEIDDMFSAYSVPRSAYFVIAREGSVLGCGGMGPLKGADDGICEIRKMYLLPELRGLGLGTRLLNVILDAARSSGYTLAYLETLSAMNQARRLYVKFGFEPSGESLGNTGHTGCNQYMTLSL
jgi:putative acetyltransferase